MAYIKKAGRSWLLLAVPIAGLLCTLIAIRIVNNIDYHNNDFFTFWLAGHMVTQGGNPYLPEQWLAGHAQFGVTWIPNQAYVYPLPLSLLFAPLGLIPLYQAYITWVALSQLMILISMLLLLPLGGTRARLLFLPLLIGIIFFRPTTLTLVNGQLTAWLLLVLVCIALLWEKGKWEWGSLLLPLLVLKPNLGGPIVLLLAAWLTIKKRTKSMLFIGLGGVILLAASMLQNPSWPVEYWSIGSNKLAQAFGYSPTVWGLAFLACSHRHGCILAAGGVAAGLTGLASLWLLVKHRESMSPLPAISLSIGATLLVTPYTWPYDQLLLIIPIAFIAFKLGERRHGFLSAALLFLGIDLLALFLLFFNIAMHIEILNAFIPLAVFCLTIWMVFGLPASPADETLAVT
jgi:hypothetical protein